MNHPPLPHPTVNAGGQEDANAPTGIVLPKQATMEW